MLSFHRRPSEVPRGRGGGSAGVSNHQRGLGCWVMPSVRCCKRSQCLRHCFVFRAAAWSLAGEGQCSDVGWGAAPREAGRGQADGQPAVLGASPSLPKTPWCCLNAGRLLAETRPCA